MRENPVWTDRVGSLNFSPYLEHSKVYTTKEVESHDTLTNIQNKKLQLQTVMKLTVDNATLDGTTLSAPLKWSQVEILTKFTIYTYQPCVFFFSIPFGKRISYWPHINHINTLTSNHKTTHSSKKFAIHSHLHYTLQWRHCKYTSVRHIIDFSHYAGTGMRGGDKLSRINEKCQHDPKHKLQPCLQCFDSCLCPYFEITIKTMQGKQVCVRKFKGTQNSTVLRSPLKPKLGAPEPSVLWDWILCNQCSLSYRFHKIVVFLLFI